MDIVGYLENKGLVEYGTERTHLHVRHLFGDTFGIIKEINLNVGIRKTRHIHFREISCLQDEHCQLTRYRLPAERYQQFPSPLGLYLKEAKLHYVYSIWVPPTFKLLGQMFRRRDISWLSESFNPGIEERAHVNSPIISSREYLSKLRTTKCRLISCICVKVKGEANTHWTTDKQTLDNTGNYRDENTTFNAHEEYFQTKYYLVGSASGNEIEIQAGEHKFPFTCTLPENLPSSFESDFGHVRYTVKAILDRPWKFDQEVKAAFTIVLPFDLNQEPRASERIREEMSKSFCCLCCTSAPLNVAYSLPVRGYVPGQSMPIKINVENLSNVTVDRVTLSLCKIVTFRATSPQTDTRIEEMVVTEVSKGPVDGGATADYEQNLDVPALPPSNLNSCGIIDLEYRLKVEACIDGWYHRNLKSDTPVFVGTIPLVNYQIPSAPPENIVFAASPTKTSEKYYLSPTSNLYPELPPPSYEESTYGAKNLRERGESEYVIGLTNHFAPKYPFYHFPTGQ